MENALLILIITTSLATLLNVFLKRFDIPTIIGYVITGFAISSIFHFAEDSKEMLFHLAEFGIVFLMFTIGLEFSVNHLKKMKKEVFLYGTMQVVLSGLLFTLLAYFAFGLETKSAIVVGFALALSSTAIVLKVLNESNQIHSGYGRHTLGILLFQDLAVVPLLLMVSFFASDTESVSFLLLETLAGAIIVFVILFVLGKYFLEHFFRWVMSTGSEEISLVAVLLVVMGASYLAHLFGFTYSLGAFIGGMMIAETKYRYRIETDLIPFRDILLGVFFVTIGMLIDWHSIIDYGHIILGLLVGITVLKGLLIFGLLYYFVPKRTALKTAMALFQVGEFSLAILALARSNDLVSNEVNQIMIITIVLSMIMTPFVLKNIKRLADLFTHEPVKLRDRALVGGTYRDHIIVCGYGPVGQKLVKKFVEDNAETSISLKEEKAALAQVFEKIKEKARAVDGSLEGFIGSEANNSFKSLSNIEKRLKKAEEQNQETVVKQLEGLKEKLFPNGSLQERTENFLNFYINNPHFIAELLDELDPFDYQMHILNEGEER